MFRNILASITMYSIVFFSVGQTAFALPQANLGEDNRAEVKSSAGCSIASTNPLDQAFAQIDLAFKDNPLLLFQRTYVSSRNEDFGLGRGWSFAFNDSIALNDDNAVLKTSTGDNFTYRRATANHYVLQTSDSIDVKEFDVENGNTISAKNDDVTKVYKRMGSEYYLSQITAPAGFEVIINRNSNGKIRSISSVSGEINFDWSNGNDAKLLAVTDNTGRRISFGQSNGSLQNATTATGGKWRYEYAGGKISDVIDPANRIILRAKFDANGRATEVGDAVGLNRLAYEINANNISTRTTFTDSLNYAREFQHNERGILTKIKDTEGTLLSIQYDEGNRPTQATDVNGATVTFEYDAQKRLTRQATAGGGEKVFEYRANGNLKAIIENGERTDFVYDNADNLAETRSRRNGRNVRSIYNQQGKRIRQEVENGLAVNSEYDNKGRETAYIYSDIGRFEKSYDAAGRKTVERLPSGSTHGYAYNATNQVVRENNNSGHSLRLERDASGAIMKRIRENGFWIEAARDAAGRIVRLTNSSGQSRQYFYDARGALIEFVGADGVIRQFQYDQRGKLINATVAVQNKSLEKLSGQRASFSLNNSWVMKKVNFFASPTTATKAKAATEGDGWQSDTPQGDGIEIEPIIEIGLGGEGCQVCVQRERNNCQSTYESTLANNTLALGGGTVACIGIAVGTVGIGGLVCQAVVSGSVIIANTAAANARDNCLANVDSRCTIPCN